jgi:hypothetical protein
VRILGAILEDWRKIFEPAAVKRFFPVLSV